MHARPDVNDVLPWPGVAARRRALLLWATGAVVLPACGGIKVVTPPPPPPPPPPKPTIVDLELKAQGNLNPDLRGRPSPLLVRIYELATPAGFEALTFDALQADDTASLKPDLVDKREHVIAPGSTQASSLKPAEAVKFIGVFASFRDLERATWRAVVPVKHNVTQRIEIGFDERSIKAQVSVLTPPPSAVTPATAVAPQAPALPQPTPPKTR